MLKQMNKLFLTTVILAICSLTVFAQDKIADELKVLSDSEQHDKIIEQYALKSKDYSAKSLYYIGLAYYEKKDDKNCIKFMDLSISKDAKDPVPHYYKASILMFMGKYNEAIKSFQTTISLNPNHANSYFKLGHSYNKLGKNDLALEAYKKATEQDKCLDEAYSMIALIYSELKENDKALEAFYVAKEKISKESTQYINVLFNIGLLESLKENYDKAEPMFLELIRLNAKDYRSYAKLIQIYYHRKEYDKAKPYKDKLYEAHRKGELKDNLKDRFCFDRFKWKDKLIEAYERFEEGNKKDIYIKHLFFVVDQEDNVEFTIQTEYSPFSVEQGTPKYVLCMFRGNSHFTFGIYFNNNFKYDDLKKAVIDILEGKVNPVATLRPSK
jgi:tetratricopeptide (TPR) repeat protein